MAKIQPQQYEPYSPNVPSGNLHTVVGGDFINFYLLESLTGDFNIIGSLKVDGVAPVIADSSNDFGGTRVNVFGGENNFATGQDTSIVNASNSLVSGFDNLILNGDSNQIIDADKATILAGWNANIGSGHDGATIIGDGESSRYKETINANSLTIDFNSGIFLRNNTFFDGNLNIAASKSGLFSGNANFLGIAYNSGSQLLNLKNYTGYSGQARSDMTGASGQLNTMIDSLSGKVTGEYSTLGTAQTITAIKYFTADIDVATDVGIGGTGVSDAYIQPAWNPTGSTVTGSSVKVESPNSFSVFVDNDGDGNYHDKAYEFTKNAFSVFGGIGDHNSAELLMGISPSGLLQVKQGLVIDQPYVPSVYNSSGHSGQMTWSGEYFYLATGEDAWGRVQVAAW